MSLRLVDKTGIWMIKIQDKQVLDRRKENIVYKTKAGWINEDTMKAIKRKLS